MPRRNTMNLHVPLPPALYRRLRAEAERTRRPATELAREAIDGWLVERRRALTHQAVLAYAREVAGTEDDLDAGLESAGVDHLLDVREDREKGGGG